MSKKKASKTQRRSAAAPKRRSRSPMIKDEPWLYYTQAEKDLLTASETPDQRGGTTSGNSGIVVHVTGILGSSIGKANDEVWLDLSEIPRGGLAQLDLTKAAGRRLKERPFKGSFGMFEDAFAVTRRVLENAGYDFHAYPYDWRRSIDDLGQGLAEWLKRHFKGRSIALTAHSMGGLVCRAAFPHLKEGDLTITHFITAGTPLRGSASPLQVMRQLHGTALNIAKYDPCHSALDLANIFSSFPGLLAMLPAFSGNSPNWFDLTVWPKDAHHPDCMQQAVLEAARSGMMRMGRPPSGCQSLAIQGDGLNTICGVSIVGNKLEFGFNRRGDGTVPHASGTPESGDRVKSFYLPNKTIRNIAGKDTDLASHGALYSRLPVAEAVISLLRSGSCDLPTEPLSSDQVYTISEAELRQREGKIRQRAVRVHTRRDQLEFWNNVLRLQPDPEALSEAETGDGSIDEGKSDSPRFGFPRSQIIRGDKVRLEIELSHGDIAEVTSKVILLGQFQGIDPSDATHSINEIMDGALLKLLHMRNASHAAGDIAFVPTGRHPIMAELIGFLGLGSPVGFNGAALASASEVGTRTLVASHFDEFATVIMGGPLRSTLDVPIRDALRHMLSGVVLALRDAPEGNRFQRIVIAERNLQRLEKIRSAIWEMLGGDAEFEGCSITLSSSTLPNRRRAALPRTSTTDTNTTESHQLLLHFDPTPEENRLLEKRLTLLPARKKGGVVKAFQNGRIDLDEIDQLYVDAGIGGDDPSGIPNIQALEKVISTVTAFFDHPTLENSTDRPSAELSYGANDQSSLELIHNGEASRLPWECLRAADGSHPALTVGLSRRYISERSKIIWPRVNIQRPRILMIINPTGDLGGAASEGKKLLNSLRDSNFAEVQYLEGFAEKPLGKNQIIEALSSETFDILHYAGHSGFSRETPNQTGLLLQQGQGGPFQYFTGADAAKLPHFPAIVVFNSCQSARIRRLDPVAASQAPTDLRRRLDVRDSAHAMISMAETFLVAGVQHYIGTFWPVSDKAAKTFADSLYSSLIGHEGNGPSSFRTALLSARRKLHGSGQADWANYIHYGDPYDTPFSPQP